MSSRLAGVITQRGASSVFRGPLRSRLISGSSNTWIASQVLGSYSTTRWEQPKAQYTSEQRVQSPFSYPQQCRQYSSDKAPIFKQVGFDDINTKISLNQASTSSSPANMILIDVREPAELAATGIIPGAVSIPLASQPDAYFLPAEEFETRFGYAKPSAEPVAGEQGEGKKEIVFYCKAGVRAAAAAQLAVQAGYDPETLAVYHGSWLDWSNRGGKVEKWEGNE